jgi:hypothetical protein
MDCSVTWGKAADATYVPFRWNTSLLLQDVEISDGVFIIQREVAEAYAAGRAEPPPRLPGELWSLAARCFQAAAGQ